MKCILINALSLGYVHNRKTLAPSDASIACGPANPNRSTSGALDIPAILTPGDTTESHDARWTDASGTTQLALLHEMKHVVALEKHHESHHMAMGQHLQEDPGDHGTWSLPD